MIDIELPAVHRSGRPIGVWYSIPEARTFLRMNADGTVWINTPDPRPPNSDCRARRRLS